MVFNLCANHGRFHALHKALRHRMHILLTLSCQSDHNWDPYNAQQYWWNYLFLTTVWSEPNSDINLFALLLSFLIPSNTISYLLVVLSTFPRCIFFSHVETSVPFISKCGTAFFFLYTNSLLFDPLINTSCSLAYFSHISIIFCNPELVGQSNIMPSAYPAATQKCCPI